MSVILQFMGTVNRFGIDGFTLRNTENCSAKRLTTMIYFANSFSDRGKPFKSRFDFFIFNQMLAKIVQYILFKCNIVLFEMHEKKKKNKNVNTYPSTYQETKRIHFV